MNIYISNHNSMHM